MTSLTRQRRARCSATATCSSMTAATCAASACRACADCCSPSSLASLWRFRLSRWFAFSRPRPLRPSSPTASDDIARLAAHDRTEGRDVHRAAPAIARLDACRANDVDPPSSARSPTTSAVGRSSARAARSSRSRRTATPLSSSCSTAGRSSTISPIGAIAVPSEKPVRTAAFTSGYRRPLRSVPAAGRDAPGDRSRRPDRHPDLRHRRRHRQRSGCNDGGYGNLVKIDHGRGIETRYGHLSTIAGLGRPAHHPRPADRPHGLDRPLDRQPPPL